VSSKPHGLSAALVCDLSQGLRGSARGSGHQPQLTGDRTIPAKGSAFFLRRTFKGDALYAAVFAKYLGFMMARGHPLEYFVEGGRSRTGRLAVAAHRYAVDDRAAYLQHPKRPVVFMPVYFGYERIVEGRTYIGELSGQPKEKESVLGLLKGIVFGAAQQTRESTRQSGQPIALDDLLDRHNPNWRGAAAADPESRTAWISAAVGDLAVRINVGINAAAAVTPINLVAMAILATRARHWPKPISRVSWTCIGCCCAMRRTGRW